jgi:hypothetical protein
MIDAAGLGAFPWRAPKRDVPSHEGGVFAVLEVDLDGVLNKAKAPTFGKCYRG